MLTAHNSLHVVACKLDACARMYAQNAPRYASRLDDMASMRVLPCPCYGMHAACCHCQYDAITSGKGHGGGEGNPCVLG